MNTKTSPDIGQGWHGRAVVTFQGALDTHIETGEDYDTIPLRDIFTLEPAALEKMAGPAFIPSTYHDFDARVHKVQQDRGQFVALTADIDSGDHALEKVRGVVEGFMRGAAWLIYSSAHAFPSDMRWRVIIPLSDPLDFEAWNDAQNALFNLLDRGGLECDRSLERAGQPVYLPNVPAKHAKNGHALRGDNGGPLYFQRSHSALTAPGLNIETDPISHEIALIKQQRDADEREREKLRREAERRRMERAQHDGVSIIDEFNTNNSIPDLFTLYGYEQSPRNGDDWRSPLQTSGSFATRVMGDKWVSLSGSDCGARLGQTFKGGCFGDAYDLFLHFEHGGDQTSAFRALYAERRAANPLPSTPPPPIDTEDPGWQAPPDGPEAEDEPEIVEPAAEAAIDTPFAPIAFDPAALIDIPPREWLLGYRLQRGKVTGGVAPGGVGKSAFSLATAIGIALGDDRLTGEQVHENGPTLVIYNEEDYDELHRRIAAICQFWEIDPRKLQGRLHTLCSVSGALKLVTLDRNGAAVVMPETDLMIEYCRINGIVYACCDPFITFHNVPENDNTNVDIAARQFSRIASEANVAIDLLHHISKGDGDSEGHAGDITRARGAAALSAAIRNSYTLAAMSEATGAKYAIDEDWVRFVRLDDGKRNYALRSGGTSWFYLESVTIPNGDNVGVIRPFDMAEIEQERMERYQEEMEADRADLLREISDLMAVPEMPIAHLASMLANAHGKKPRWARDAIQSVIPPLPAVAHTGSVTLSIDRRGTSIRSPIFIVKDRI